MLLTFNLEATFSINYCRELVPLRKKNALGMYFNRSRYSYILV